MIGQVVPVGDSLLSFIVLDPFPRNIYRDSPQAFASDPQPVELTFDDIACGHDLKLPPRMRIFLYMPLMHAEDLALQNRGVEVFESLDISMRSHFDATRVW